MVLICKKGDMISRFSEYSHFKHLIYCKNERKVKKNKERSVVLISK